MQALQQEKPTLASSTIVSLDSGHMQQWFFGHRIEFEVIADILHRQFCHHLILRAAYTPYTAIPYLTSLHHYLQTHGLNKNACPFLTVLDNPGQLNDDSLLTYIRQQTKVKQGEGLGIRIVVIKEVPGDAETKASFYRQLCSLLNTLPPSLRFVIFDPQEQQNIVSHQQAFASITPAPFTQPETIALLKYHLSSLLAFHQITIPDDIVEAAYTLAKRYLPQEDKIKQTLLLLDSALARMRRLADNETNKKHRRDNDSTNENEATSLSLPILHDVIASQIQIPANKLERFQFDATLFAKSMENDVTDQHEAIYATARRLQQVFTGIQMSPGPLFTLLLAGANHTGKSTLACSLAKHLLEHQALYSVLKPYNHVKDFAEINVIQHATQHITNLKAVIMQKPYVFFFIEDVDTLPPSLQVGLEEILTTGYLPIPMQQTHLDFHQTGFILTTTLGADILASKQQEHWQHEAAVNQSRHSHALAQFINTPSESTMRFNENHDDIAQMTKALKKHYYGRLSSIVPFLPLTLSTVQTILQKKMSQLVEQLRLQYQVELEVATEVLRYLSDKVMRSQHVETGEVSVEETFKLVYHAVEKELAKVPTLTHLYLQLSESGDTLQCRKQ